ASCRHTHHAMDLVSDLAKQQNIDVDDVEKIEVGTYDVAINITDNDNPQTVYQGKFSLQYCTALALVKKNGNLDTFTEENLWDEEVRNLMDRVNIFTDDEVNQAYPEKWGSNVKVHLK